MSAAAKQVRPHVYADPDGAEWRCVDGMVQCRERDETQPDGMEVCFQRNTLGRSNEEWRAYLAGPYRASIAAFDAAVADPMDEEAVEEDDVLIQEARERASQPWMPAGRDRREVE